MILYNNFGHQMETVFIYTDSVEERFSGHPGFIGIRILIADKPEAFLALGCHAILAVGIGQFQHGTGDARGLWYFF